MSIMNDISNALYFLNQDQLNELYISFISACKLHNINVEKIKPISSGESSIVFEVDNQILKVSFIDYDNHESLKEYVSKSSAILQPNFEYIVDLNKYYKAKILGMKKLLTDEITEEDVYKTYSKLKEDGYLWYDTKKENLGKDENGNCYLIDYGELIYINDLDEYHREKELESHRIKKPEFYEMDDIGSKSR